MQKWNIKMPYTRGGGASHYIHEYIDWSWSSVASENIESSFVQIS